MSAATVTKVSAQVVPLDPTSVRPSTPIILSLPPSPFSLPLSPSLMPRATIPDPACQSQWISTLDSMSSHPSVDQSTLPEIRLAITQGIRLPFLSIPPPLAYRNTPSVYLHIDAVRTRLQEYIEFGALRKLPCAPSPMRVQPLHVVLRSGRKPRLVIDLSRNLNSFLPHEPFSYTSVEDAIDSSAAHCYYGKMDLSNCFLSFPIHPDFLQYFVFELDGDYFQFTCMPFGLAPAPRICTLLLSVISFHFTQLSIPHVRYLDDFLFVGPSAELVRQYLSTAAQLFRQYGLVVNPDKTEGPSQVISFLGIQIDSVHRTLSCTPDRLTELRSLIESTLSRRTIRRRQLRSLLGKFSFAAQVLPGARPFMRRMIDMCWCRQDFDKMRLAAGFQADLYYWHRYLQQWNGTQTWRVAAPIVMVSDASLQGFGFYLESVPSDFDCTTLPSLLQPGSGFMGFYSACHSSYCSSHRSISWCELFAVLYAAHAIAPYARNRSVTFVVDNSTDVSIINRQSTRSPRLAVLLRALYDLSVRYNFRISAVHRAGDLNVLADFLSRPSLHHFSPLRVWSESAHVYSHPLHYVSVLHSREVELVELSPHPPPPSETMLPLSICSAGCLLDLLPAVPIPPITPVSSPSAPSTQ